MTEFKLKEARAEHICKGCDNKIDIGDNYYCEDRFLASLNKQQKYCLKCFKNC